MSMARVQVLLRAQRDGNFFPEKVKKKRGRTGDVPAVGAVSCSVLSWEQVGVGGLLVVLLAVNSLERTKTPTSNFGSIPSSSLFRLGKFWAVGLDFFIMQSNIFLCPLFASEVGCVCFCWLCEDRQVVLSFTVHDGGGKGEEERNSRRSPLTLFQVPVCSCAQKRLSVLTHAQKCSWVLEP